MKEEKGQIRQLTLLGLVLFMIASILGVFILFQPDDDRFGFYLNAVDTYLERETYKDIPDLLIRASRYAENRENWFSLFKRSYLCAFNTNDYIPFYELLNRSRKFLKAGPEHDALYTASLLWTDQYEKAAASLYAVSQEGFESLTAETLLSFEVYRNYSIGDRDPIEFIKEKIAYQEDPDFFEVIGRLSGNEILLYNAVILYLESANTAKAEEIVSTLSSRRISPFRLGVVHYDLMNYEKALEYYQAQDVIDEMKENQRYSMKEQIGDVQFLLGRSDSALHFYEAAVATHDSGSWKLYRNIARLYYAKGYSRKAKLLLEKGLSIFPDQIELLTDYVRLYYRDYSLIVENRLNAFISRYPDDMQARLLKIRYFPDPMNATQYQSRLWEYFNASDNSERITRFLLWYLAGLGDSESMEIVLKRYDYGENKPHWYLFYEGILASLQKNPSEALKKMEEASVLYPSWLYESNKSALNLLLGNHDAALEEIIKAIEMLEKENTLENSQELLSDLYVRLGDMYLDLQDFKAAMDSYSLSIQYNPENFKAKTKLNRIQ